MGTDGWMNCSLGDLAANRKNALVGGPFGSNLVSADYVLDGVPVIRGQNMGLGRWVEGDFVFVTPEKADTLSANIARPGDLVFTQRGTLGQVAIVPKGRFDRYVISQSQMKVTIDELKADSLFVYYYFTSQEPQEYFRLNTIQTGVPHTNLGILRTTPIRLPSLAKQCVIRRILGRLDDKIELNQQMNETLEAMAQAIFKSWFADFDPVRAKAEGRIPYGLDDPTAALFPDSFQVSPLGKIPKGWEVGTVDEEFNLTMGQSPPGETYNETGDGLPFFQGRADFGFRFPKRRMYCSAPTRFAERGDTLVSVRAPVGDINMATERCCVGRGVAAVRHKTGARSYTYYSMRSLEDAFARFEAEGTVFGSIGKKDFHGLICVTPPADAVTAFERVVGALDDRLQTNEEQSRTLAAIRDALLPKIISGEVRVKHTERLLQVQP